MLKNIQSFHLCMCKYGRLKCESTTFFINSFKTFFLILHIRKNKMYFSPEECTTKYSVSILTIASLLLLIAGSGRNGATRDSSFEPASAASVKPELNVSRPFATPTRPSFVDTPSIPASRLPRKTPVSSKSLNRGSIRNDQNEGAASLQGEPWTVFTLGMSGSGCDHCNLK